LREDKHKLNYIEILRLIVRKQTGFSWGLLSTGRYSIVNLISNFSNGRIIFTYVNPTEKNSQKKKRVEKIDFQSRHEDKI
jgi:hypothetical protein